MVSEKGFVSFAELSEGVWFTVLGLLGDPAADRPRSVAVAAATGRP
jgi:hypothetical protein